MRRRTFLIVLAAAVLALVVLIVGLAAGLTVRKYVFLTPSSSSPQTLTIPLSQHSKNASPGFLPLPSDTQQFTGDLTYFGDGLGACGVTSTPDQDIVAVSHFLFDAEQGSSTNPNSNPLCGLIIRAERFDEQVGANRSVDLTVVDRCVGCQPTDLDVSTGAFTQLADMAAGRVTVTWAWLEPVPTAPAR
jgi:expansin (peptidoglycan-binding protein)